MNRKIRYETTRERETRLRAQDVHRTAKQAAVALALILVALVVGSACIAADVPAVAKVTGLWVALCFAIVGTLLAGVAAR